MEEGEPAKETERPLGGKEQNQESPDSQGKCFQKEKVGNSVKHFQETMNTLTVLCNMGP